MQPIIGIDLGTSTSEVAILKDGRPEVLEDANGDRVVPSVVQLTPNGELIVGRFAKNTAVGMPERTVSEVKRLMGSSAVVTLGDRQFRPEEISAIILRHLKSAAENKFGKNTVTEATISVPARFHSPAREATTAAAEMAGLKVLRLINEPTAAALSYGLDHISDEQKVLVFDFGGGTLDVTVLEMMEGVLDVRTSVGDDRLGGKDIDELLIQLFRTRFHEQKGFELPPAEVDRRAAQTLKQYAEDYKRQLSATQSVAVEIPYLSAQGGISFNFTRADFEELLAPLVDRSMHLVDDALKRAKLTYADIDVILPVGGSSRIPAFRRELEARWGKQLKAFDNPDEAVVRGAAIQSGIELRATDAVVCLDVTPHRLGVAVVHQIGEAQYIDDYFSEIIPKDDKLPAIRSDVFATLYHAQESILIRAYEATTESNLCADHRQVASLPLENIPKAPAGQPIEIKFAYNLDKRLDISAWCVHAPEVKVDQSFEILGRADAERMAAASAILDSLWQDSEDVKRCTLAKQLSSLLGYDR